MWSVFGPIIYADRLTRIAFIRELLELVEVAGSAANANVWLWRRLPHPDTLVSGGPEIDFGIHTEDVFLLGEAKWRSPVGEAQGINRDKSQVTLRREFCLKYGRRLFANVKRFVVLGVSRKGGILSRQDTDADDTSLHLRDTTWERIAGIESHPCASELRDYLEWKVRHSLAD